MLIEASESQEAPHHSTEAKVLSSQAQSAGASSGWGGAGRGGGDREVLITGREP